jgi:SHS2 domain-containing protein
VYRWVDHTAELELAIEATGPGDALEQALTALAELLEPDMDAPPRQGAAASPAGELQRRAIDVAARDGAGLFAAWLEELVFLAESEGFVAQALVACTLGDQRLETVVDGRLGSPRPVVKAVTYHRLAFESRGDGYVANVVLDV